MYAYDRDFVRVMMRTLCRLWWGLYADYAGEFVHPLMETFLGDCNVILIIVIIDSNYNCTEPFIL